MATTILIPYRERPSQLKYFLEKSVPLISEHIPDAYFLLLEQEKGSIFNIGFLYNIGIKESGASSYLIMNNLDMNPTEETVRNLYTREDFEVLRIHSPHSKSLGDVVKIKKNGFIVDYIIIN